MWYIGIGTILNTNHQYSSAVAIGFGFGFGLDSSLICAVIKISNSHIVWKHEISSKCIFYFLLLLLSCYSFITRFSIAFSLLLPPSIFLSFNSIILFSFHFLKTKAILRFSLDQLKVILYNY